MIGLEDAGRHHRPSTGTDLAETAARALRGRGVFLLGGEEELPPIFGTSPQTFWSGVMPQF